MMLENSLVDKNEDHNLLQPNPPSECLADDWSLLGELVSCC